MARVLIIEDNAALRGGYNTVLSSAGHEVFEAANGAEGLRVAEEAQPDLILLDVLMPVMDGLGFLREYNLTEKHPDVVVVVFSNSSAPDQVAEAKRLGAKRHLIKAALSPREIVRLVESEIAALRR